MSENATPKVTLGQYKGLHISRFDRTVTEADLDDRLRELQREKVLRRTVEDRPAKIGDIATINYEGFLKGRPFLGGKADDYPLEIGSGSFIPGFEEQIVGHEAGEEFEIEVTFPEQYHSEDLAGKETVFRILLTRIEEKVLPELDDNFAALFSKYKTLAEFKEALRRQETERREEAARQAAMEQALIKAIENAQISDYEELAAEAAEQMFRRFSREIAAQGMELQQYLSMVQLTTEGLRQQMHLKAEQQVRTTLVLLAVAEEEELTVTEEELAEAVRQLAAQYKISVGQMSSAVDVESLKENLLVSKAAQLIAESAVEM